ncbi:DinB family protein [Nocardioides hungaricus]
MPIEGQRSDRQGIHRELERVRADFHHLVVSATSADLRRRTNGTRWTNGQMLWHMAFGGSSQLSVVVS